MPQGSRQGPGTTLLGWTCAALVAAMVVLLTIQVVGRYVLHSPPVWTEELARVAFVYATFFGGALAVARRAHLGIDLLANALGTRNRAAVQIAWRLIACATLSLIVWQGYLVVLKLSAQPLISIPISKGFMFAAVPLGCALILIYELGRILHEVRVVRTGEDPHGLPEPLTRAEFIIETHRDERA